MNRLVVFSGLPVTGKSTLSDALARSMGWPVFSVDPLEATLWRAGITPEMRSGYAAYDLLETLADIHLGLGQSAILDAVNALDSIRAMWRKVARQHAVPLRFVMCVCSDEAVHRQRVESRRRNLPGFMEPTWEAVVARRAEIEPWTDPHLEVDSRHGLEANLQKVLTYVTAEGETYGI